MVICDDAEAVVVGLDGGAQPIFRFYCARLPREREIESENECVCECERVRVRVSVCEKRTVSVCV